MESCESDVNRLEGLAELAYRPPHERPCANPRRIADALHRGESHAAEVHRQPRLPQGALALRQRARLGADDPVEGRRDDLLSRSRAASMVSDGGMVRRKYTRVVLLQNRSKHYCQCLLRDLELGRVLELHDTVERLEGLAHALGDIYV